MRLFIFTAVLMMGFMAHAGTSVCSNDRVYYSNVLFDVGAEPPQGTVIGNLTIVLDGEVLLRKEIVKGLGRYVPDEYVFNISQEPEDVKLLESTGNRIQGSTTYKSLATVGKRIQTVGLRYKVILEDEVVCKKTWLMAL